MHKNLRVVPHLIFGRGGFSQLDGILEDKRSSHDKSVVFLVDDVHQDKPMAGRIPRKEHDLLLYINVDEEPKTKQVDALCAQIRDDLPDNPIAIVGLGGGSILDLAKAVSLLLTNPGSAADYQGWDLIKNPGVYHIGIPTLAGTGAEISRTTVLTGPTRKLGINSDFTPFDQIILDPDLVAGVPKMQWFYTGMDCFIHNIESLAGTFINTFARAYAEKSLELCRDVFLRDDPESEEKLMVASYFGGMSIAYSQVGVCHALSYGLSFLTGAHHGVGNCIVFNQLAEYYQEGVKEFHTMLEKHQISLPRGVTRSLGDEDVERMIDVAFGLEPLWQNALGLNWRELMTREKARALYQKM